MENSLAGGWSPYSTTISPEQQEVFKAALSGLLGVSYTPIAVATQVVAGKNYSFFCNAVGSYPNAANGAALIGIYAPLEGKPGITGIQALGHYRGM